MTELTELEEAKIRRAEGIKAHAKLRDEVRNAVREAMLSSGGISREEINSAVRDSIKDQVDKRFKGASAIVGDELRKMVREEILKMVGGAWIRTKVERLLVDEIAKEAKEFVSKNVAIKVIEGDTW